MGDAFFGGGEGEGMVHAQGAYRKGISYLKGGVKGF